MAWQHTRVRGGRGGAYGNIICIGVSCSAVTLVALLELAGDEEAALVEESERDDGLSDACQATIAWGQRDGEREGHLGPRDGVKLWWAGGNRSYTSLACPDVSL